MAITGASGSGKSSLVKLLLRYYDPDSGRIELDGQDLRDLDLASIRQSIGYVDQDCGIYCGSIYENLTLGCPDIAYHKVYPFGPANDLGSGSAIFSVNYAGASATGQSRRILPFFTGGYTRLFGPEML